MAHHQAFPPAGFAGVTRFLTFEAALTIANGLTEMPPPMKLAIPGMKVISSIEMNRKITSCKHIMSVAVMSSLVPNHPDDWPEVIIVTTSLQ